MRRASTSKVSFWLAFTFTLKNSDVSAATVPLATLGTATAWAVSFVRLAAVETTSGSESTTNGRALETPCLVATRTV